MNRSLLDRWGRMPHVPAVITAMVVLAAACGGTSGGSTTKTPFLVGVVVPYTGSVASYGKANDEAWQLAFQNYGNSVNGHLITLQKLDEKCPSASAAVEAVTTAIGNGVLVLDGPTCSGDVAAAMPKAQAATTGLVVQAYTPDITAQGNHYVWRIPASDAVLNGNLAKFAKSKGFTQTVVIHDTSGFGQAEGSTMIQGVKAAGATVAGELTYTTGATDFSGLVSRLKSMTFDSVYLGGYDPDTARIALQMQQVGIKTQIFANQALSYDDSIQVEGTAAEGAYMYAPFIPTSPRWKTFADQWKAKFNATPDTEGYNYYLTAVTIMKALETVGDNPTPDQVNSAIAKINIKINPGNMASVAFQSTGDPKCPAVLIGQLTGKEVVLVQDNSPTC